MSPAKVAAIAGVAAAVVAALIVTRPSDSSDEPADDSVAVAATAATAATTTTATEAQAAATGSSSSAPVSIPAAGAEAGSKSRTSKPAAESEAPEGAGAGASASSAGPPRPRIAKKLIPYPQSRKDDMAAYSKRHYGEYRWQLVDPRVIVIHYAEAGSVSSIYNTFAPNRPDVEYHELPGVCSHYAVSAKGVAYKFVPPSIRCRHTVGLNQTSIGIEHVGFSDGDVLGRKAELKGSLALTQWLRCTYGIGIKNVIGHNESLDSPFYKELDPDFQGRTHGDFDTASMNRYRRGLRKLGAC